MSTSGIVAIVGAGIAAVVGMMYVGTFNGFQNKEMLVTTGERKIASCYQKRADTLTNMEATVNRAAGHEKDVVIGNAQARTAANATKLPDNATPDQITAYVNAQSGVMARINSVVESVPSIKANVNFLLLQKDLKGIEAQCAILRNQYIDHVGSYNAALKRFPSNIVANMHGLTKKDQIKFDDEETNKKSPRLFKKD